MVSVYHGYRIAKPCWKKRTTSSYTPRQPAQANNTISGEMDVASPRLRPRSPHVLPPQTRQLGSSLQQAVGPHPKIKWHIDCKRWLLRISPKSLSSDRGKSEKKSRAATRPRGHRIELLLDRICWRTIHWVAFPVPNRPVQSSHLDPVAAQVSRILIPIERRWDVVFLDG